MQRKNIYHPQFFLPWFPVSLVLLVRNHSITNVSLPSLSKTKYNNLRQQPYLILQRTLIEGGKKQ